MRLCDGEAEPKCKESSADGTESQQAELWMKSNGSRCKGSGAGKQKPSLA